MVMEKIWVYAAMGGFIPTLAWLFFWLREDNDNSKEPIGLIIKTFLFGSAAAYVSIFIESYVFTYLKPTEPSSFFIYSMVEEFTKFFSVFIAAYGTVWWNERTDPMIYMLAGALGFSAIENMYYIIDFLHKSHYMQSVIESGYRIIGATLLHTSTSAIFGVFVAVVIFRNVAVRLLAIIFGLSVAIFGHGIFNIVMGTNNIQYIKIAFFTVWGVSIILFILFEFMSFLGNHKLQEHELEDDFRKILF